VNENKEENGNIIIVVSYNNNLLHSFIDYSSFKIIFEIHAEYVFILFSELTLFDEILLFLDNKEIGKERERIKEKKLPSFCRIFGENDASKKDSLISDKIKTNNNKNDNNEFHNTLIGDNLVSSLYQSKSSVQDFQKWVEWKKSALSSSITLLYDLTSGNTLGNVSEFSQANESVDPNHQLVNLFTGEPLVEEYSTIKKINHKFKVLDYTVHPSFITLKIKNISSSDISLLSVFGSTIDCQGCTKTETSIGNDERDNSITFNTNNHLNGNNGQNYSNNNNNNDFNHDNQNILLQPGNETSMSMNYDSIMADQLDISIMYNSNGQIGIDYLISLSLKNKIATNIESSAKIKNYPIMHKLLLSFEVGSSFVNLHHLLDSILVNLNFKKIQNNKWGNDNLFITASNPILSQHNGQIEECYLTVNSVNQKESKLFLKSFLGRLPLTITVLQSLFSENILTEMKELFLKISELLQRINELSQLSGMSMTNSSLLEKQKELIQYQISIEQKMATLIKHFNS
jgi:hypothetical protein